MQQAVQAATAQRRQRTVQEQAQAEAEERSRHYGGAGWNGILDLRVVPSEGPVNARWTRKGLTNQDGKPFYTPPQPPTPEEIQEEAKILIAAWVAMLDRMDFSQREPGAKP